MCVDLSTHHPINKNSAGKKLIYNKKGSEKGIEKPSLLCDSQQGAIST